MKKYRIILFKSLKSQLVYRSAMILGAVRSLFYFAIQISLWYALLGQGYDNGTLFSDMILYIIINTVVLTLTNANIANMIESSVINGSVSMQIIRPVSYKYYLLSSIVGRNLYKVFTDVLPVMAVGAFLIDYTRLPPPPYFILFLISVAIGMLIMFEITYIVGLLAFWIQRCWFLICYQNACVVFFGGTVVPLWFYPKFLYTLSYFLPFRYITFEPVNLFLQKTPAGSAWIPLLAGAVWLAVLSLLDQLMWRCAVKKMAVNGG